MQTITAIRNPKYLSNTTIHFVLSALLEILILIINCGKKSYVIPRMMKYRRRQSNKISCNIVMIHPNESKQT